jgi:hypothetical protein
MSIGIYAMGFFFLISGFTYLAYLNNLSRNYILGAVLAMLGVAVVTALQTARRSRI